MYYVCYARHISVVTEQALLVRFAHICGCLIQHPSGDEEIRTLDPLLARQVLSQLSYIPIGYFPYLFLNSAMPEPVGLSGLEPPTSRLSGVRSNQLSYKPILKSFDFTVPSLNSSFAFGSLSLSVVTCLVLNSAFADARLH